ncbi:MAG TPA: metallophosphoesterase [Rubrivivax sp.]|nr:metallophosphoesterase [Rubrivivax sp.]
MKLLLLSDLHLELSPLQLPQTLDFDVAVLAGDIINPGRRLAEWVAATPALRRARAVVAVAGNHEYFDATLQAEAAAMQRAAAALAAPPLHLLDGGEVRIDGVRFVGCTLWTDFALRIDGAGGARCDLDRGIATAARAMADYRCISWADGAAAPRLLRPLDTLQMHRQQRRWLQHKLAEPCDGPTVVVTHHGPHRGSLAPRFAADWVSTAYLSELPESLFEVPVLWLHGHTHTSHDHRVGRCRVVCNPRGCQTAAMARPENRDFRADCVLTL